MAVTTVTTRSSVYEFDQANNRVRRRASTHEPLPNQTRWAQDGDWQSYLEIGWQLDGVMIVWAVDEEAQVVRRTLTSTVMTVDGPPLPNRRYSS